MTQPNDFCECIACGKMTAQERDDLKFTGKLRGEVVEYTAGGFCCTSCNSYWSTGEQQGSHDLAKAEAYRKQTTS